MPPKYATNPFVIIIFLFLCLFAYTKFFGPISFSVNSVQTVKQSSFQVTGEGKATAVPNQATVDFGVTKQATTVGDAQNQTNAAVDKILQALKSQGIDTNDVKTTNYSVNPQYNYLTGSQNITGYQVTQTVEVKIKQLEKANSIIDVSTANGANIVNGVQFGFDDAKQKELTDQARTEAVKQAKEKAEGLAKVAGFHLGKIVDVQENFGNPVPIMPLMALDKRATGTTEAAPTTQVTPGENEVSVTVTLSYETY